MDRAFHRLAIRSRPLGNHARKYLSIVERHGDLFLSCLDRAGTLGRVHTDRSAPSLADDFDHVAASGRTPEETLRLLGTFYAVQFLHQNARSLERLALDLAEAPDRLRCYREFLHRIESDFFRLVGTYVIRVLRVLLSSPPPGPYLIGTVGTRGHQDDIDVAIIDSGNESRAALDRTFARLSSQMLRYASTLDHYLAGSVGAGGYCVSIAELKKALHSARPDFVVITELLRAEPLAGSRTLYRALRREIVAEYFHRPGQDNTRHELYLRGILGEIRALLLRPPAADAVHPKDDGLRLVIGLTSVMKTVERLRATQPRELLTELRRRRPDMAMRLSELEDSVVFLDTFRHLFQVLVTDEEEVEVRGEVARGNLARVAAAMGYADRGVVAAADHLLVNYREAVESIHKAAAPLMEEVTRHLAEYSRFSRWTRRAQPEEAPPDLARQFGRFLRRFTGVRFWDDLIEALAAPDGRLLCAFVESFAKVPPDERRALAFEYADWGCEAPYTLLSVLNLIAARGDRCADGRPAAEIRDAFLERLAGRHENLRALARVFRYYPDLMNRFLLTLDDAALSRFRELLEAPIGNPEVAEARDRLQAVIAIHRGTSRYVKRVLARVTLRHPATVLALPDDLALVTLAQGRLADGERHPKPEEQLGLLGDSYDMGFLRIAVGTLRGKPRLEICTAFQELTTTYVTNLFDLCLRQTEREAGRHLPEVKLPAIYLTGGNARGRPFDEDYDLLVLTCEIDEESRPLIERAVARMNREIARRGVIAQYRLADRFGRFATGLDEVKSMLAGDDRDLFVDACQLLGSRFVTGSQRVERHLVREVLQPLVFERWESFVDALAREVRERRDKVRDLGRDLVHLKEMPGGFREIDICLAATGARLGQRDLCGESVFERFCLADPDNAARYRVLAETCDFLVHLRSVYRVTVAASDVIEPEYLGAAAEILHGTAKPGADAAQELLSEIRRRASRCAEVVEQILTVPVGQPRAGATGGAS